MLKSEIDCNKRIFTGNIEQTPPIYSAVKIDGVRAYKLARNKKQVIQKKKSSYIQI